jgi:hypothetical protein
MAELKFAIYRSVKPKSDTTTRLHEYRKTMRPPGNVPYVVDNLWEWKRPKNYPNRRCSVFASPIAELAVEAAKGGSAYTVHFNDKYKLCQVKGYWDSKKHPDCKKLRKLLFNIFGQEWIDGKLKHKEEFGKLWIPCLTKNDMNSLFGSNERLREIRDDIYNAITYWNDVALIKNGMDLPDPEGELFFEAEGGYYLRTIE